MFHVERRKVPAPWKEGYRQWFEWYLKNEYSWGFRYDGPGDRVAKYRDCYEGSWVDAASTGVIETASDGL